MKPRIGLVGYFGWGNFGDELFIEAHKEFLSDDYELEVVNDMTEAPYLSEKRVAELDKFDGFLIGGGDLINPSAVSPLYWRQEYLNKPVFVYGIGVPQPNKKGTAALAKYKEFFAHENVKATVLRDVESMRYFNSVISPRVEAVTFPDAVCAMTLPKVEKSEEKIIGFTIRHHRSVVGGYGQIRKAADYARELGYKVRVIVMANGILGELDHQVSREFARADEEIVYTEDLQEVCKAIGQCDQIVSMKFHGMIVAAMYQVPSVQLSATAKNKNFLRYIQRQDMQSNYMSEDIYTHISHHPAKIHSLLVRKLKRDSTAGYSFLKEKMHATYYG